MQLTSEWNIIQTTYLQCLHKKKNGFQCLKQLYVLASDACRSALRRSSFYPTISSSDQTQSSFILQLNGSMLENQRLTQIHVHVFFSLSVMNRSGVWIPSNVFSYSLICTVTPCLEPAPPPLCLVSLSSALMTLIQPLRANWIICCWRRLNVIWNEWIHVSPLCPLPFF